MGDMVHSIYGDGIVQIVDKDAVGGAQYHVAILDTGDLFECRRHQVHKITSFVEMDDDDFGDEAFMDSVTEDAAILPEGV